MAVYSAYTDQELVALLKQGDQIAFTEIYNRYWHLLFLNVRKIVLDDDIAQDVVQEIFTLLWQRSAELDFNSNISGYLYGVARNKMLNRFRHEKVKAGCFRELGLYLQEGYYQVDEELRYKELVAEIESEIEKMPPRMREIFDMSRKEQLSHREIAAQLGIAESSVREQVKRALKILRLKVDDKALVMFMLMHLFK